jgi:hypothetical protein
MCLVGDLLVRTKGEVGKVRLALAEQLLEPLLALLQLVLGRRDWHIVTSILLVRTLKIMLVTSHF